MEIIEYILYGMVIFCFTAAGAIVVGVSTGAGVSGRVVGVVSGVGAGCGAGAC